MHQLGERLWWVDETASLVNVYLWDDDGDLILFDSGAPWQANAILNALAGHGFAPSRVRHILLTHADIDHIGGAQTIRETTGASLACHAVTGAILQGRLPRPMGAGILGKLAAVPSRVLMGPIFHCIPLEADTLIVGDSSLPGGFKAIFTPGHCPGHLSFYHPEHRILITGDAIRNTGHGLILPSGVFMPDRDNAIRSVQKLARLSVAVLCPGHGEPITEGAQARLQALAERLQAG